MSNNTIILIEILFNITYLVAIWSLVVLMIRRLPGAAPGDQAICKRFIWAFALLALGDTGHVGFRVIAYAQGGLEANPTLVGLGALATAFTVTIFYMLMVDIWRLRLISPWAGLAGCFWRPVPCASWSCSFPRTSGSRSPRLTIGVCCATASW